MKDLSDFKIRFATAEDTALILRFIKGIAEYEKLLHEVEATEDILRDSLFVKKQAEVIIAEWKDIPVGFALFFHNFSTFTGKAGLYLEDLFVWPEYRGKGFGKALFTKLAEIAQERNCPRYEWICLDWNKPSIDFYLSMGAKAMDEWTVYRLEGEKIDNVVSAE